MRDEVTAVLLEACLAGESDRGALDRLVPLVYDELRRLARAQLAREGHRFTIDTTGLVHEAYVKLVDGDRAPVASRAYFFGAAARAMRQVLVDAARRRLRHKRGGGAIVETLDEAVVEAEEAGRIDATAEELLALDRALEGLTAVHPRAAEVVECRYFAGLGVEETAAALSLAPRTVNRDLALAQAWLRRELGPSAPSAATLGGPAG